MHRENAVEPSAHGGNVKNKGVDNDDDDDDRASTSTGNPNATLTI